MSTQDKALPENILYSKSTQILTQSEGYFNLSKPHFDKENYSNKGFNTVNKITGNRQVFDYGYGIDMNLGESLLKVNGEINKDEPFLMYVNFVVNDLLIGYCEDLDGILIQLEDIKKDFKISRSQRKEFYKEIDNTKKTIISKKYKILKNVNDIINKSLIELNNGDKQNQVLLKIINSIADIISNDVKQFFTYCACFCIRMNSKVAEKVEAIRIYHEFACSKDPFTMINEIKKNINGILTQKDVKDITGDNQAQILDDNSSEILGANTLQKEKLNQNVKDIESIIDSVRLGIVLLMQNYPYKFSIIYKRLQVAVEQLSEIEKLRHINESQETIIKKQEGLISYFKKIEQDYLDLKKQTINDGKLKEDQRIIIENLESQIKQLQEKLESPDKNVEGLQDDKNVIKSLEDALFQELTKNEDLQNKFDQERISLNDKIAKKIAINTRLNLVLESAKAGKGKEIETFINNCEIDFKSCSNDELIKYVFYNECADEYKKEAGDVVVDFLSIIFRLIEKKTSSTLGNDGVGGGGYLKHVIRPIINFIKQKQLNMGSQEFLEEISYLNWKKIIEQYSFRDDCVDKKQKMIKNILSMFSNDCKSAFPIFRAFKYLANKLKTFHSGDTNLSILVSNINDILDSNYVKNTIHSRLVNIAERIKETKKQNI